MASDAALSLDQKRLELKRELLKKMLSERQQQTVFREDTGKVVSAPAGADQDYIKYLDDTKNNNANEVDFFGAVSLAGSELGKYLSQGTRGFFGTIAETPVLIEGAERLRFGEAYQEEISKTPGPADVLTAVNIFESLGTREAAKDKILSSLGISNVDTSRGERWAQSGAAMLEANKMFLARSGLDKQEEDGVFYDIGSAGASILASVGLTMVTKNPAYASFLFGEMQRSGIYVESREAGKDPAASRNVSNIAGAFESGLEFVGGKVLLDAFGQSGPIKRTIVRSINEAIQEGSQQTAEEAVTNVSGVRDSTLEESLKNIGYSALLGFVVGAPVSGLATYIETRSKSAGLDDAQSKKLSEKFVEGLPEMEGEINAMMTREAGIHEQVDKSEAQEVFKKFENGEPVIQEDFIPGSDEDFIRKMDEFTSDGGGGVGQALKDFKENFSYEASKILEPISTRIRQISPKLFYRMRSFEKNVKVAVNNDLKAIYPFLQKFKSLSSRQKTNLDYAMKNGTTKQVDALARSYGFSGGEVLRIRQMLDSSFNRAKSVGVDVEYRKDLFPRKIKNLPGLLKELRKKDVWTVFDQAFEKEKIKLKEKGKTLSTERKEEIINGIIRGQSVNGVSLKDSGVFGKRTIEEIDKDINKFYERSDQALISYVIASNEDIEVKRLFGKGVDASEDSIGKIINDMVASGEIDDIQAINLKDALGARFNQGRVSSSVNAIKNIMYAETMGSNFGSTLRQLGDLGISAARYGVVNTTSSIKDIATGKSLFDPAEFGVVNIAQEFESSSYTGAALRKMFDIIGISQVDRLGKKTLIESSYKKIKAELSKDNKKRISEMKLMFGDKEYQQVVSDFKSGKITEDVKLVLFNELLDVQPVAALETPEAYLRAKNGKILYTLKLFTIRQVDLIRRDAFQKIRKGVATKDASLASEGMVNFMKLMSFLLAMHTGVDYVIDIIKNMPSILAGDDYEPPELEDKVIQNIYKTFGLNKYSIDQLGRPFLPESPSGVFADMVAPPTKTLDNFVRDINSIRNNKLGNPKDLRTLRSLPIGGELWWFWFGGGAEGKSSKTNSNEEDYVIISE